MKHCFATLIVCGFVSAFACVSHATVVGFGQIGGSNANIAGDFASRAVADGNGFVVSNGATPNVVVSWADQPDQGWQVHTSGHFSAIESQTVGGGAWDNEGDIPRIGQLDGGSHHISFAADPGYAVVINSFDFGHTAETPGTTTWDVALADSSTNVVWSESLEFVNGAVVTLAPNFTGDLGESYLLSFNRTSETYGSNGRHGIDNVSFNQVAVPEPTAVVLAGCGILGLVACGRRRHV